LPRERLAFVNTSRGQGSRRSTNPVA
jgi:hypothetical protein